MSQPNLSSSKFSLTQRALLTLIGSMLVHAAEFLTGFFITPFIIRGLGQELYGAWGMIQQTIAYFSLTDFRATTALRFLLGLKQHEKDTPSKQRLIGAALMLSGFCIPLAIAIGIGLIYFAPLIIRTSPAAQSHIRIALAVLLVNSVTDRVLAIPMNVLRAQNMDYVGMGINTITVFGGSLLSGAAIWLGFGLPGLAIATIINVLLISIGRFVVARKALPWISAKLPSKDEFFGFFKTSVWLLTMGIGTVLVYSTDTMIVGLILGPSVAATYVTTGIVMRMVGEPMYQVISSGNAGLMGLCGQKNWERVASIRKEMYYLLLFFMSVLGTGVIALNNSFLSLWVGHQFSGGSLLTIGIVLSMTVLYLSRIDLLIADAMLYLREKTWAIWIAGSIVISTAALFIRLWGIVGIALSTLMGNLVLLVVAWILINKRMGVFGNSLLKSLLKPLGTIFILFFSAFFFSIKSTVDDWVSFTLYTAMIGSSTLIISWLLVLPRSTRVVLLERIKKNMPLLNKF